MEHKARKRIDCVDSFVYDEHMLNLLLTETANIFKRAREENGFSVSKLGERANVDRGIIYRMESGQNDIRLSSILKLCYVLRIRPDEIFPIEIPVPDNPLIDEINHELRSADRKTLNSCLSMIKIMKNYGKSINPNLTSEDFSEEDLTSEDFSEEDLTSEDFSKGD